MISQLSDEQVAAYNDDGFILLPQFFSAEQIGLLHRVAKADRELAAAGGMKDAAGAISRIRLRNDLPEDIYSAFACNERVVSITEQLLGDEAYHFHHKMMLKEPRVGGAWEWHQDFGYWYQHQHVMFPDMLSVCVAVDTASRANGCLQVLRGSHKCGRIDHMATGGQSGADLERVQALIDFYKLELVYAEQQPGDALFFHCNTLHRSDQNKSEHSRWTLISCYNAKHNDKYKNSGGHPAYAPLPRWPDARIIELGERALAEA